MGASAQGLSELLRDLEEAQEKAPKEVEQVVSKGCLNIKAGWRARWSFHRNGKWVAGSITYDIHSYGGLIVGEVGPDKDLIQGPLGNLIEFGSIHNAPIPGGMPALEAETPNYEKHLADVLEKLVEGHG